jgi:hypothetical protein
MQTTGNGKVYVAQPLDWEQQSSYLLNISITDGHNTIYTQVSISFADSSARVGEELGHLIRRTLDSLLFCFVSIPQLEITVLDVNDHPPVFSEQHYRAEVSENAEVGAEIITLNALMAKETVSVFL